MDFDGKLWSSHLIFVTPGEWRAIAEYLLRRLSEFMAIEFEFAEEPRFTQEDCGDGFGVSVQSKASIGSPATIRMVGSFGVDMIGGDEQPEYPAVQGFLYIESMGQRLQTTSGLRYLHLRYVKSSAVEEDASFANVAGPSEWRLKGWEESEFDFGDEE